MLPSGNHLNNLLWLNSLNALGYRFGRELHSIFKQMIILSCLLVVLHLNLSIVVLYALLYWEKRASKERHLFHTILKTGIVCLLAILRVLELSIANAGVHLVGAKALSRVHCVLHVSFCWLSFSFLSLIQICWVRLNYNYFSVVIWINLRAFIKRTVRIIRRIQLSVWQHGVLINIFVYNHVKSLGLSWRHHRSTDPCRYVCFRLSIVISRWGVAIGVSVRVRLHRLWLIEHID
jgi:hypothetical protein